jgi:hypothetical protein
LSVVRGNFCRVNNIDAPTHTGLDYLAAIAEQSAALATAAEGHLASPVEHCPAGRADARVWTWAPTNQTIGFITRHQVQEAAVHRWDAEHAAGRSASLDAALATDAVEEILIYSVSTAFDHPNISVQIWPAPSCSRPAAARRGA